MKTQKVNLINNNYELPEERSCLIVSADWSGASISLMHHAQQIAQEYSEKITFIFWDYDDLGEELRLQHDIKAVPLLRLNYEQQIAYQQYGGNLSKAEIKGLIYSYLNI